MKLESKTEDKGDSCPVVDLSVGKIALPSFLWTSLSEIRRAEASEGEVQDGSRDRCLCTSLSGRKAVEALKLSRSLG